MVRMQTADCFLLYEVINHYLRPIIPLSETAERKNSEGELTVLEFRRDFMKVVKHSKESAGQEPPRNTPPLDRWPIWTPLMF